MKFKMIDKKDDYEAPSYKLSLRSDGVCCGVSYNCCKDSYKLLANNDEEAIKATENWIKDKWVSRSFFESKKGVETFVITDVVLVSPDGRVVMEAEKSLLEAMNNETYFCSENFDYDEKVLEQLRKSKEFQKAVYHNVKNEAREDFKRFSDYYLSMDEKLSIKINN